MFELQNSESPLVTKENFRREVIRSAGLVLVEFFTKWSGACHIMEPVIKEVMIQYSGQMKFYKVDFEAEKEIVARYNISKSPAFLIFRDGRIVEKFEGVVSKKVMLNKVKILLRNSGVQSKW